MQYEERRKNRPGHTTGRYHKRCLNRAKRHLVKVGLAHNGITLSSMRSSVAYARSNLGHLRYEFGYSSHNTKPKYKVAQCMPRDQRGMLDAMLWQEIMEDELPMGSSGQFTNILCRKKWML